MIEVEALRYRYPGAARLAVDDVSFRVPAGAVFGLLGPSGAGKSTLQKLLIGLLPLQEGAVRYDGVDLRSRGRDLFQDVGVSFEHPNLFPRLTALENLAAFAGMYDRPLLDPLALLDAVGLADAAHRDAADLSKGMKQRLVFARALLHQPRFLFLDEPTSGLDPGTTERVLALISARRDAGAAIVLTTHDMHVAEALCDQVALVDDGRVVALDTPRALKLAAGERSVRLERRVDGRTEAEVLYCDRPEDRARLGARVAAGDFETMHSQEATLGAVFIQLTGRGLL